MVCSRCGGDVEERKSSERPLITYQCQECGARREVVQRFETLIIDLSARAGE